jgi:hypothetical protein
MSFANTIYLVLVLALVPILWWGHRRRKNVGHTQVGLHKNVTAKPIIGWIILATITLMWIGFCIAMAGPRQTMFSDTQTAEARDIVIMVDTSGSMTTALQLKDQQDFVQTGAPGQSGAPAQPGTPAPTNSQSDQKTPTRANAARMGVQMFVEQRKGDRMALLLFDDQVYEACLFTFSQNILEKKVPLIDQYQGGGTNFDGPNDNNPNSKIGAIQGAIDFFKANGQSKSRVLIMVTDGEDSISDKRFGELAQQIKDLDIHMYTLGVGESWTQGQMVDLRKFTEAVGGKVFIVGNAQALNDGFAEINRIEKSKIVVERLIDYKPLYWLVLIPVAGLLMIFLFACMLVREED